jgi:uncharacterized protein YndB with AHSA1/START domain
MTKNFIATATTTIDASVDSVWAAITEPAQIKEFMFGSIVKTDWTVGSSITYSGEWEGKPFEDKGIVVDVQPGRVLSTTHFSPLSGKEDSPENYHTVTYTLDPHGDSTTVTLTQDNNESDEDAKHSADNWMLMLAGLKKVVEAAA